MSEVASESGADNAPSSMSPPTNNMAAPMAAAPALRVEELRDDELEGASSTYGSEDEAVHHHTASDADKPVEPQEEFKPPDDELKNKIITQVEFYFSDANILKDTFLLKHVRRNKLGYVSIKLITSFKKVKSMTKDYRVVAFSLRQSEKLEVNDEGTKVRRKEPLPDYDETTPSRTVVAVNLPMENPTIENVAELFSKCGEIALVRILRPGKAIPQDVKKHINKHPEIGNTMCAVVEFEQHDAAKKACESMTNTEDWRKGMRVMLLAIKKEKPKEKKAGQNGKKDERRSEGEGNRSEDPDGEDKPARKRQQRKKRGSRVEELSQSHDPNTTSGSDCEPTSDTSPVNSRPSSASRQRRDSHGLKAQSLSPQVDPNKLSPNSTPRSTPKSSPRSSPRSSPTMRRRNPHGRSPLADTPVNQRNSPSGSPNAVRKFRHDSPGEDSGSSPSSPWVQRRLKAQQDISPLANSPGASPRLGRRLADGSIPDGAPPPRLADLMGVLRQPRGPDGTKGFYGGKGRGQPLNPGQAVA